MVEYDVAIVGSGPAGAACALGLARQGASVLLIDENEFPRTKVCGEYLNCGAVRELHDLGVGTQLAERAMALRGMRLFAHGEQAEFPFTHDAWSIPRITLDGHLRAAALDAGALAFQGRVRAVTCDESSVTLSVVDGRDDARDISARYLIGADGMRSAVARLCKLSAPSSAHRFATGGHYRGVALERWIEMYAGPRGYFALNPLDDRTVNAMFVVGQEQLRRSRGALSEELSRFSRDVSRGARQLDDAMLDEKRRTIGPLDHRTIRMTKERVLLVGDAAAFVDPFSGQGVYLSLIGARVASSAVGLALRSVDRAEQAWHDYAQTMSAAIAERGRVTLMMKAMLSFRFASRRAARSLRKRPERFASLIEAVCGNSVSPMVPQLALALARAVR